jgi:8-oxo-dGTP diphosphatase
LDRDIIHVGIGCLVFKQDKLLMGRRVDDTHGNGEYSCGGGHVELGENLAESARREIREEWDIDIELPRFLCVINLRSYSRLHNISFGFTANWTAGEPRPQKTGEFADFRWCSLDALPAPLFRPVPYYLEALQTGRSYFELE